MPTESQYPQRIVSGKLACTIGSWALPEGALPARLMPVKQTQHDAAEKVTRRLAQGWWRGWQRYVRATSVDGRYPLP